MKFQCRSRSMRYWHTVWYGNEGCGFMLTASGAPRQHGDWGSNAKRRCLDEDAERAKFLMSVSRANKSPVQGSPAKLTRKVADRRRVALVR
jgi:hypothetical protein